MKRIMFFLLIFVFIPCLISPKHLIQVKANRGDFQQNNILMNNYWNFWVNYEGLLVKSHLKIFMGLSLQINEYRFFTPKAYYRGDYQKKYRKIKN